nr:hypothetical protein [Tanacetum cinerariifolium]
LGSPRLEYVCHVLTQKPFRIEKHMFPSRVGSCGGGEGAVIGDGWLGAVEEEDEVEVPIAPTLPSLTNAPSPVPQDPTPIPHTTPPASPPQEQPTTTSESTMSLLNTLMDTYASLSQKVAKLEQDKNTQALEILKLKQRVKKLEKKKRSNHSGLKRLKKVGRIYQDVSAATKDVITTEPTVFNDEEVTMTMAQTLIKMKAKKAKLLDEQIAQRLHDEEV